MVSLMRPSRSTGHSGVRLLGLVAVVVFAGSCSSGQSTGTATVKQLTWGLSATPATLFAPTHFSAPDSTIMGLIQDNLLIYTGDGKLVPSLAESWTAPDPTTYTYKLRSGVKFSDGNPVTPDDVIFSLQLQTDSKYGSREATLFANVDKATASGNMITVKLKKPDSLWKWLPTHMGFYIYEKKDVLANLQSYGTPQHPPIGSGPYMVKEFVPDSRITLVRNPNFWGTKPVFDSVVFQIIPDDQTRLLAMQRGDINGTWNPPPAAFDQWSATATISTVTAYIWRGLTIDTKDSPFDDIHVRRALYYATDREGIAKAISAGKARASNALDDPGLFAGILSSDKVQQGYGAIATYPFDIAKAKAELAQSKVPNGFTFTINVPQESSRAKAIAEAIKESWSKIGVNVTLNLMPGGPRFQIILNHGPHLGVQIIGNLPDVPDATELLWLYFSGDQAAKDGNNSSNLKDSAIDALILQALNQTDPAKAAELDLQIQQKAAEQVPIIPILWENSLVAIKKGWTVKPMNGFSWSHNFVESIQVQ